MTMTIGEIQRGTYRYAGDSHMEFIPDKVKALKVEGRVTGNMKLAMDMVPNRNFINTSFGRPSDLCYL